MEEAKAKMAEVELRNSCVGDDRPDMGNKASFPLNAIWSETVTLLLHSFLSY